MFFLYKLGLCSRIFGVAESCAVEIIPAAVLKDRLMKLRLFAFMGWCNLYTISDNFSTFQSTISGKFHFAKSEMVKLRASNLPIFHFFNL